MSNDFLRDYTIPIVNNSTYGEEHCQPNLTCTPYGFNEIQDYNGYDNCYAQQDDKNQQNQSRFVSPGKAAGFYKPARAQKRKFPKDDEANSTYENRFMGRCEEYPGELNVLFKALNCELCNVQFNSGKTAHIHYESKAHDKNITNWLTRNYTDNGLEPPILKRFYKSGPVGPDAFYCEDCDLKLTSKSHADQHYTGRKHQLVVSKISKPSGAGYYNEEGKWVRTGTKATPTVEPTVDNDGRFGIGEDFKKFAETKVVLNEHDATNASKDVDENPAKAASLAVSAALNGSLNENFVGDDPLHCMLCNIRVTSAIHLTGHLQGAKHLKKLKAFGEPQKISILLSETILTAANNSIAANDFSMFRTPSGSYYCNTCNTPMNNELALSQHLSGKKHQKSCAAAKAATAQKM